MQSRAVLTVASSESKGLVLVGVLVGVLSAAFITALWLVFAGAAAGNEGATAYFKGAFMRTTLAVFGGYVTLVLVLYILRWRRSALCVAWAPALLVFVVWPNLSALRGWFV